MSPKFVLPPSPTGRNLSLHTEHMTRCSINGVMEALDKGGGNFSDDCPETHTQAEEDLFKSLSDTHEMVSTHAHEVTARARVDRRDRRNFSHLHAYAAPCRTGLRICPKGRAQIPETPGGSLSQLQRASTNA